MDTSLTAALLSGALVALLLTLFGGGALGVLAGTRLAPHLAVRALLARRLFAAMIVLTAAYVAWRALN